MTKGALVRQAFGAAAFFAVAPGSVAGLAPWLITGGWRRGDAPAPLRIFGVVLVLAACLSLVESFVRFVTRGHGTPAPVAPPTSLVVTGQYRHVRNPMYVALILSVIGQSAWLGRPVLLAYGAPLWVLFHLRVLWYEEPRLARQFGAAFEQYRRAVPRWVPRLTAWSPATTLTLVLLPAAAASSGESVSVGTTGSGSLKGGVSLPAGGAGFTAYSRLGNLLGRQYVHSRVRDTLLASFAALHAKDPERTFVVGETGLRKGGRFRPHKTHQNGLSVDIFMPVRDACGRWAPMPATLANRLGYGLEFDPQGKGQGLAIDFAVVAELLVELDRQTGRHGLALERVIVAPEYVAHILNAKGVVGITRLAPRLSRRPAWVRHDEHLHVDFRLASPHTAGQ